MQRHDICCTEPLVQNQMDTELANAMMLQLKQLQGEFTRLPGFQRGGEVASLLEAERALQASALQLSSQRVGLLKEGLSTQVIGLLCPSKRS